MLNFRLNLPKQRKKELQEKMKIAQQLGKYQYHRRLQAIYLSSEGYPLEEIGKIQQVSREAIRQWLSTYLVRGVIGLRTDKREGRPAKLSKTQKRELARIIAAGPLAAGFSGGCWRSPMIQELIKERFGIFYSVHYISQLLKNMGFSYQKARFVSDQQNPKEREEWLKSKWPEILRLAKKKSAHIFFEDEVSFPQWGTLTYTWARKGEQPTVKTSGSRKSYKVFGVIDYFTGKFISKAIEGRLNSASYQEFIREVLSKTRKHIILIHDGAKYHTSQSTTNFLANHAERITLFPLPAYSPDFNPIEKLWKKIKEKETHLHYFPDFVSLKSKVHQALLRFEKSPNDILPLFDFYVKLEASMAAA